MTILLQVNAVPLFMKVTAIDTKLISMNNYSTLSCVNSGLCARLYTEVMPSLPFGLAI